jgi:[protein-PII] uridylyltransferase
LHALLEKRSAVAGDHALTGRAACTALAHATDEWLVALFDDATSGNVERLALVAAGGYGRDELAPGSDLDVWLLHERRGEVADIAQRIWYPIWDAGLKLGHAVYTTKDALRLMSAELDTATAALSLRYLAGDRSLVDGLAERADEQWRKRSSRWLAELDRRVEERHAAHGEVAFLLEPNIKEGRGGLRDVHALGWAQRVRQILANGDDAELRRAEDVLLDVRVALHRLVNRPSDDLALERQDDVANALGIGDADVLMAHVSGAARTIAWVSDEAWRRVRSSLAGPRGRALRGERSLGAGLLLRDDEVHVDRDADVAADPTIVVRAGAAAAELGAPIDRPSLDRLAAEAPPLGSPWPPGARDALVALLATGPAAIPVFEALDQRRLIERAVPEWTPLRSRPQRNALHRFTVDRHLCEAAAEAAGLVTEVSRPDLLLVAAWLHDIGKGYPGDHTEVGMQMIATIAERMGFAVPDREILVRLVRDHLLLPDVATRRDLADPDVIASVAERVGSVEVLELLAALSRADGLATGPSAWSSWKAELVHELVVRTAAMIRGDDPAVAVEREAFPDARTLDLMQRRETTIVTEPPSVIVVTNDRVGTFSRIAGTLALHGVTVVGAEAASRDGVAAARFRVETTEPATEWERVTDSIRRALNGQIAIAARLAQRRTSHRQAIRHQVLGRPPTVRIDNAVSSVSTVVEVRANDAVGVLYRITRAFVDVDVDIRTAKIATLGDEVLDTFYVRNIAGTKLDDAHVRELERAIYYQLSL